VRGHAPLGPDIQVITVRHIPRSARALFRRSCGAGRRVANNELGYHPVEVPAQTPVRTYVACSAENEAVVDHYKDQVKIIQMPKKGGVGLTDALHHIAEILSGPAEADWPHFFH